MSFFVRVNKEFIESLVKHKIRFEEYVLLHCLSSSPEILLGYFRNMENPAQKRVVLQSLVRKQLLSLRGDKTTFYDEFSLDDYVITELGEQVLEDIGQQDNHHAPEIRQEEPQDFVAEYLSIFPQGVKNGGNKYLRSHPVDVRNKLAKFRQKYKYESEVILKATQSFVNGFRRDYTYCPTAEYFIMKGGTSALATECERIVKGGEENIDNPFITRM